MGSGGFCPNDYVNLRLEAMEGQLRRTEELFVLAPAQGKRAPKGDGDRCLTDHSFEGNTSNSVLKKYLF